MTGTLTEITRNLNGKWRLTFEMDGDCRMLWDKYHNKAVDVDVKQHRNRRSLSANGYCWVLIDKIAEKLRIDKVEVYREAIRGIGGVSDVVCVQDKAVESLRRGWEANGMGWQTETMPSKLKGCTNVTLYYGSSTYDTKQMSALIDHVIQDAKALGIETMTPQEINSMMRDWHEQIHTAK